MTALIKNTVTADAGQAIREIDRLQKELVKLRESNLALASGARINARENRTWMSEQLRDAKHMVTSLLTVRHAVGIVTEAYREWRDEMTKVSQAADESSAAMVRTLSKTGDLMAGAEVERAVAGARGVSRQAAIEALEGVSGAAPTMQRGRRLAVAIETARGAVAHGDSRGVGGLAGQIAEILGTTSAEDVLDVVTALRQAAGGRAEELTGRKTIEGVKLLTESGAASGEEALALVSAIMRREGSPELVNKVAALVTEPGELEVPRRGERLSPEAAARNAFIQMTPRERYEAMLRDPAIRRAKLGEAGAARFGRVTPADVAAAMGDIERAKRSDLATRQVEALGGFAAGERQATVAELGREREGIDERLAAQGRARRLARENFELEQRQLQAEGRIGPLGAWINRRRFGLGEFAAQYAPQGYREGDDTSLGYYQKMLAVAEEQLRLQRESNELARNRRQLPDPHAHDEKK